MNTHSPRLFAAGLAASLFLAACGSEAAPTPTPTKTPTPAAGVAAPARAAAATATPTPLPPAAQPAGPTVVPPTDAPTPTPVADTPWARIVAAYVPPDGNPDTSTLGQSFTDIMTIANEVVMDSGKYTADEAARAQAIFDAAAGAHDALMAGDSDTLAARWKSLDTFVALLKNASGAANFGNSEVTPTPGGTLQALGATLAAGVVAKVADDAVGFVLERGAANVTADQLTAALLGVLGRLKAWTAGTGGETALADCRALLPGVIARADNKPPLEQLLAACEGGDPAAVGEALAVFAGIMP